MFPSKMSPTTSPFLFTTGLPELPPMMSAVQTKLNGVVGSSRLFRSSHRGGRSNGGRLACSLDRSYRPSKLVNGATALPFSEYPLTVPNDRRRVNVASG